ncbi:MAG: twin-arginine translocase TatA/TatE family subunit [Gammaproteobacteria bacterium]|nr:twin-arginine translocase TatA/TatE family subunit [Gammaproteobacteria bacterium]
MNFSISEILLILLVALLVIKPEQLPDVAFSLGRFTQSMRRLFAKVKDEMNGFIESVEPHSANKQEKPLSLEHKHEGPLPAAISHLSEEKNSELAANVEVIKAPEQKCEH